MEEKSVNLYPNLSHFHLNCINNTEDQERGSMQSALRNLSRQKGDPEHLQEKNGTASLEPQSRHYPLQGADAESVTDG